MNLLAQTVVADPVAPWGALILQGGAFALLAYIVIVLAPRMLTEAIKERQQRDESFSLLVGAIQDRFEVRNREIILALQEQTRILGTEIKVQTQVLRESMTQSCRAETICANFKPK